MSNEQWAKAHYENDIKPAELAEAWAKGYTQGITDERISEANIGIAGFNCKVEPARENPYLAPTGKQQVAKKEHWLDRMAAIEGRIEPSAREMEDMDEEQVGEVHALARLVDVLIPHVMDRCIRELRWFIEVAHDYDLDEMAVQALETAIESMELRKQPAQGIDLGQFRPAALAYWSECKGQQMNAVGGPFAQQNAAAEKVKEAERLLALIDQRSESPGVENG